MTAGVGVQSCIFFESVLAKKVRTDPDEPAVVDHYDLASFTSFTIAFTGKFSYEVSVRFGPWRWHCH